MGAYDHRPLSCGVRKAKSLTFIVNAPKRTTTAGQVNPVIIFAFTGRDLFSATGWWLAGRGGALLLANNQRNQSCGNKGADRYAPEEGDAKHGADQ